jgi:hypothetical protein
MTTTPNLKATHITEAQQGKEVSANTALDHFDNATQRELEKDVAAGGTITLTDEEWLQNFVIKLTGAPAGAFNLDVPDGDRHAIVWNVSGQTCTFDTVTGGAASIPIFDTAIVEVIVDGIDATSFGNDLVNDTTPELGGDLVGGGQTIGNVLLKDYHETETAPTSVTNTLTLDVELGNVFSHLMTENTTLAFTNPTGSGDMTSITLIITQDSTPRTLSYPASVVWDFGLGVPIISTGSGAIDILTFFTVNGGTTWFGFVAGQAFA